ncbi:ParD-like family protein [Parvularcula sp. BGMRC 0090]|uniref:ParD-like family protein n=1 Tax=Parvularcula maris TaxID=2965077 RepID=A0A9X2RIV9_9PROT|nr:ParD-like family protein [Parvularcula maris]MCQ8186479.1 ParD-like family protein [Parvularcula maris]
MKHLRSIYSKLEVSHGHRQGSGELHDEVRRASSVMCRSINAQGEFWMKIGMLAVAHPTLSYNELLKMQLDEADVGSNQIRVA